MCTSPALALSLCLVPAAPFLSTAPYLGAPPPLSTPPFAFPEFLLADLFICAKVSDECVLMRTGVAGRVAERELPSRDPVEVGGRRGGMRDGGAAEGRISVNSGEQWHRHYAVTHQLTRTVRDRWASRCGTAARTLFTLPFLFWSPSVSSPMLSD